jgi:hypothetical protein
LDIPHRSFSDAGLIFNASKCSVTTGDLRTSPKLHEEIQSTIDATRFFIPDKISVIGDNEISLVKEMTPDEVARFDDVKSKVTLSSQTSQLTH